jgi:YVTN family beta-propeller protein
VHVAVGPAGRYAFLTQQGGTVSVIDSATLSTVSLPAAGGSPAGIAVTARNLYVVDTTAGDVLVFDLSDLGSISR